MKLTITEYQNLARSIATEVEQMLSENETEMMNKISLAESTCPTPPARFRIGATINMLIANTALDVKVALTNTSLVKYEREFTMRIGGKDLVDMAEGATG